MNIFESARQGDLMALDRCVRDESDLNRQDEQGWTALHFAAGGGHLEVVSRLLALQADVMRCGEDGRTPYLVALAAGHRAVAETLKRAEESAGGDPQAISSRGAELEFFARAYPLSLLRQFPGWKETAASTEGAPSSVRPNEDIVFVHQDYKVTESVVAGERIVFDQVSAEWRLFCTETLGFKVPSALDLIAAS